MPGSGGKYEAGQSRSSAHSQVGEKTREKRAAYCTCGKQDRRRRRASTISWYTTNRFRIQQEAEAPRRKTRPGRKEAVGNWVGSRVYQAHWRVRDCANAARGCSS
eukprot:5781569-Pleurochrysis_carterae.AAC.2